VTPVFVDIGAAATDLFRSAGRRRRLIQLKMAGEEEPPQVVQARLLEPVGYRGTGFLRIEWPREGGERLAPGAEAHGFFVFRGETYAFETSVVARQEGWVNLRWPARVVRVLRRRHRRVGVPMEDVVGVRITRERAPEETKAALVGILRDVSVSGAAVNVARRALEAWPKTALAEGGTYWLAFALPGVRAAEVSLPATLRHRAESAGRRRIRCGFQFEVDGPAGREAGVTAGIEAVAEYVARVIDRPAVH
jgi:hypothetical protein